MSLARDRAIVLRLNDFSETSQVVTLFAREVGKVKMIAKGARRRTKAGAGAFDGGLDLLDAGEAVFRHAPEKDLSLLTQWQLQDGHLPLRADLRAMHLGLYAAELLDALVEEHDPHPATFDRLQRLLAHLPEAAEESFLAFELDLLRETGNAPELERCARCGDRPGADERVFFSPAAGGLVCQICEGKVAQCGEADPRLIRLMRGMLRLPDAPELQLPRLGRQHTDPLNRMLADHVEHVLGKRLRMPSHVLRRR